MTPQVNDNTKMNSDTIVKKNAKPKKDIIGKEN